MRSPVVRILETVTLGAGVVLVAFFLAAHVDGYFASRAAVENFEASVAHSPPAPPLPPAGGPSAAAPLRAPANVDFSLWSAGRIRAYRRSLAQDSSRPLALLRIPKIDLTVPVFDGTGALALNRGVGHIEGTALPGEPGNLGIAGHRDGFFRGLKELRRGDVLELVLRDREDRYLVDRIEIVAPEDVSVLAPRAGPALTLVTCYPFYYIGSAPKRYVVEASLASEPGETAGVFVPLKKHASEGETGK